MTTKLAYGNFQEWHGDGGGMVGPVRREREEGGRAALYTLIAPAGVR